MWVYHILINLSVDGYLGCFHLLAIMNKAVFSVPLSRYIGTARLFQRGYSFTFPLTLFEVYSFSASSLILLTVYMSIAILVGVVVVSHCGFNLHFPND